MTEEWPKFTCETHLVADHYVMRVTCTYPKQMFAQAAVQAYADALIDQARRDAAKRMIELFDAPEPTDEALYAAWMKNDMGLVRRLQAKRDAQDARESAQTFPRTGAGERP